MVPIDSKNDRPWLSANATLVLLDIRKKAELDLLRLDEHRSGGLLNAANGYATCVDTTADPDSLNRTFRPDPVLASFKHSGVDTDILTAKRWADFCSVPRDEEKTIAELGLGVTENAIAARIEAGASLEAEIAALGGGKPIPVCVPASPVEEAELVPVGAPTVPDVVPKQRRSPRSARVARS